MPRSRPGRVGSQPGPDQDSFTDNHQVVCTGFPRPGTSPGTQPRDSVSVCWPGAQHRQAPGRPGGLPAVRGRPVARRLLHRRRRGRGPWMGAGAERLGLAGEVAARRPAGGAGRDGAGLGRSDPERRDDPAAPAAGAGVRPDVQGPQVGVGALRRVATTRGCRERSSKPARPPSATTLGWLEREAIHVRRGTGNERVPRPTSPPATPTPPSAARHPDAARPAGSWPRCSGIAPAGPVTRCCTGTPWSPTWSKAPTGGGRRSSTPTCTAPCGPPARCSRPCCGTSSPSGSGSSGGPAATSPRSPVSPRRCATGSRKRSREIEAWLEATGTPDDPAGPPGRPCSPPGGTSPRSSANGSTPRGRPRPSTPAGDPTPPKPSSPRRRRPRPGVAEVWRLPSVDDDRDRCVAVDRVGRPRGVGRRISCRS